MQTTGKYFYRVIIGTESLQWFGGDDLHARRVTAKWVGLFWAKLKEQNKGSIAYAVNNGWYDKPATAKIGRVWCEGSVVPCKPFSIIDDIVIPDSGLKYERGMLLPR